MGFSDYKLIIEDYLAHCFENNLPEISEFINAISYSLLSGGKRLRPSLVLEFNRICGGKADKALPIACACEMLHTYSLIHDDLPCMDNDSLRRGKPTNHIVYGETIATLAGDALQAEAFSAILDAEISDSAKLKCFSILTKAAGLKGICAGQYIDLTSEGKFITADELDVLNSLKTGALLSAACMLGVACAEGNDEQMSAAENFGLYLGKAFQIRDDILDAIGNQSVFGKPIGSDSGENKTTYMSLLGEKRCNKLVENLTNTAKKYIYTVFSDTSELERVADSLVTRNY